MSPDLSPSPDYAAFLAAKAPPVEPLGFEIDPARVNPAMKPHAAALTLWGVKGGRRGYFTAFGLHKTTIQLETGRLILEEAAHAEGLRRRGLIVLPLGVRQEFVRDAVQVLGWDRPPEFIRETREVASDGLFLTNYESVREGKVDPEAFTWASLDEASCLRSYGSKTFQSFLPLFRDVPYRHVATATPSPNRFKELIHYAGFLGVMDTGQALTRFFQRNPSKAGDLTLYPHKEEEFWLWVNSWGAFVQKPSDLGFSDEGYDLPPLRVHWHEVDCTSGVHIEKDGQVSLLRDAAGGVVDAAREKRLSIKERVEKVLEIIAGGPGTESLSEGLLPQEPGGPAGEAACPQPSELSGQQGGVSQALGGVEGGQSGADEGAAEGLSREQRGHGEGPVRGLVCRESPASLAPDTGAKAEALRTDVGTACRDGRSAAGSVPDLPDDDASARRGSLSSDGSSEGTVVPPVQCGDRAVEGQSGDAEARASIPEQVIVWCDLNDEQAAVEDGLEALGLSHSSLCGSQSEGVRETLMDAWRDRRTTAFIAKPVMYGAGVNLQQAHRMVFCGIGYKAQDTLQAIHRIYRFQQTEPCDVHFVFSRAERSVRRELERKWEQHNYLVGKMSDIIRKYGLDVRAMAETLKRSMGVERVEASGRDWTAVNSDCVEETRRMAEGSVDLIVTSIPFANHYEYTPNYSDFGHTDDNDHFWAQMDYLSPELFRVLAPGRIAAIHVKDRILFGSVTGYGRPAVSPFHAEAITHFRRHGFVFAGMVTINTDVVHENNGTYRLGYTEMCKDGSRMGVGSPEYLLLFFKPQTDRTKGYADVRVARDKADYSLARWQIDAHAFWRSSGERLPTADELALMPTDVLARLYAEVSKKTLYDHETHVRIGEALEARGALPSSFMVLAPGSHDPDIWHDVSRIHTLNGEQSKRGLENHICPLQFDIVDRAIRRWSNPGDTVFDPFGGLMTVPYRALKHGRKGIGVELNPQYFLDGVAHLKAMEEEVSAPSLFDLMDALPGPSATPADSSLQKMQSAPAEDGDPVPARLPATGTKIRTILALVADGTDSARDLALTLDDTSASIARDLAGLAKQGLVRNTSPGRKVGRYVPTEACLRLMGLETAAQDRPEAA